VTRPNAAPTAPAPRAARDGAATVEEPLWFGPGDRPLAGRLHLPVSRRVRGAVVVCPPLGWERIVSYRTLRAAAEQLADSGLAALRIDYAGTGDSFGDHRDPGQVPAWQHSISAAVQWLREAGIADVALLGLRHGGTLAASVADEVGAAALVAWDPVTSGRSFVRALRAFDRLQGLAAEPGSVSMSGATYTDETVAALGALELAATAVPTLALLRPEDQLPPALADASVLRREGQAELLDGDSVSARLPAGTVRDLVSWLTARAPHVARVLATPELTTTVVGDLRERFVFQHGLAGVETGPADPRDLRAGAPTVLLLTNSAEPHTGPGRAWTEWARTLAGHGVRSLRMDLSGIGDSPARPGAAPQLPWGPHVVGDITALAASADAGSGVALVGLCSGGRNALDATAALGAGSPVRTLMLINPPLAQPRPVLALVNVEDPTPAALVRINSYRRVRHNLAAHTPGPVWRALDRFGVFPAQTGPLSRVVAAGCDVLMVYAADDFGLFKLRQNARWALADLSAEPGFTLAEVPGADHALFDPAARRATLELMTAHLLARYPGEPGLARDSGDSSDQNDSGAAPDLRATLRPIARN
jgi:dienelactone hydrolase